MRFCANLCIRIARLPIDNVAADRADRFAMACVELGLKHQFIHRWTPRTGGRAERLLQAAPRERAPAALYEISLRPLDTLEILACMMIA